jgi:predicted metal-dependent enzyme (double-stranded beta helix superfamily)
MPPAADGPVHTLLERVGSALAGAQPDLAAIGSALVELAADRDYLDPWIRRLSDGPQRTGALMLHAPPSGPRLALVHRPVGGMSAVHDHGTWVAVTPIAGIETHRRWRVVEGSPDDAPAARIELAEDRALGPPDLVTMLPPDDLHDHGHLVGRGNPAHVLILLGDDQTRFRRTEWDLASGRRRILEPGDGGRWMADEPMPDA